MKLDVRTSAGGAAAQIDVDDAVFGIEPNEAVVHQTLLAQLAGRRAGSANTKTRGQVRGSTRKTRPQKGGGTSRQGSIRSPLRRGGGVVFGPSPRSFVQRLPKMMRRLAVRSVLSARAADQRLLVVDGLGIAEPSTKAVVELLKNLGVERSALIVTGGPDRAAHLSARNVDGAQVLPADTLNVGDMLSHHTVLLTVDAVRRIEALWGGERASDRRAAVTPLADAVGA